MVLLLKDVFFLKCKNATCCCQFFFLNLFLTRVIFYICIPLLSISIWLTQIKMLSCDSLPLPRRLCFHLWLFIDLFVYFSAVLCKNYWAATWKGGWDMEQRRMDQILWHIWIIYHEFDFFFSEVWHMLFFWGMCSTECQPINQL